LGGLLDTDGNYGREGGYEEFVALGVLFECIGLNEGLCLFENF
jgi:hypothetical protein